MQIELEGWKINVLVDDDGMLELCISNHDESPVIATDTDKWGDNEWGERFTTKEIENANQK
jgi:hypothetical protein